MLSERLRQSAIIVFACGFFSAAHGAVVYSESAQGDFSNSGLTPTLVTVDSGSNQIFGATGNPGNGAGQGIDLDYFVITVPSGMSLSAISVLPGTSVGGGSAFIGVQAGNQVTVSANPSSAAGLLGWTHYSTADIDNDILARMGTSGFGSTGFVPPLPSGSYAFWVQELSAGTFNYGFDVMLVPEPTIYATFAVGLALLLGWAMRRRRAA